MTTQEILKFIKDNEGERIVTFFDKTHSKITELNRRIDRISISMLLTVLIYFVLNQSAINSVQIGPISISDFKILHKLLPLIFSFFLLQYSIISVHRAELMKVSKWIFLAHYKQQYTIKDLDDNHYSAFARVVLPFSFWTQIQSINFNSKMGCIGALLILPLLSLIFLPFYFEFILIKSTALKYWNDFLGKVSVIGSIWMGVFTIYFYVQLFLEIFKEQKREVF